MANFSRFMLEIRSEMGSRKSENFPISAHNVDSWMNHFPHSHCWLGFPRLFGVFGSEIKAQIELKH